MKQDNKNGKVFINSKQGGNVYKIDNTSTGRKLLLTDNDDVFIGFIDIVGAMYIEDGKAKINTTNVYAEFDANNCVEYNGTAFDNVQSLAESINTNIVAGSSSGTIIWE
jgi:hypothetical protein